MKVTLDRGAAILRLEFEDTEALASFVAGWKKKQGFLVRLGEQLRLCTDLTVVMCHGSRRLEVAGRVVQVFGGGEGGFATALEAADPERLAELAPAPAAAAAAVPAAGPAGSGDGEAQGASPAFRIRAMNVSERMRLATRAGRSERQILLRDSSPQVLMGLLANPRIEDKEILALAQASSASGGVLQRIAKDRRWAASYEIRLALVKNPQTPTPLALRLLDTLREPDLRVLAKAGSVREAIRGAALRLVIKRG